MNWQLMCAVFLLGGAAAAGEILNFNFEAPDQLPLIGEGRYDRGKPINGQALFLDEESYAEIPASPAWR